MHDIMKNCRNWKTIINVSDEKHEFLHKILGLLKCIKTEIQKEQTWWNKNMKLLNEKKYIISTIKRPKKLGK